MVLTRWLSQPSYTVLDGEELSGNPRKSQGLSPFLRWLLGAILLSATFAFGCMSAKTARDVAQYQTTSETEQIAKTLSLEFGPHEFVFNRTFGEDSSAAVKAWEDLFPRQGGYFRHPVITPQRATFSVYHYLHCLNGIREGYWAVYGMALAGTKLDPAGNDLPVMISPPHIRHCVDLLRQALICSPDLTVEVKDEAAGGVHGFGETHQCVDWTNVKNWTSQWESWEP